MRSRSVTVALVAAASVTACSAPAPEFTLYRNSPIDHASRIQFASFDTRDSNQSYNLTNCQMTARLLNANVSASVEGGGQVRDPFFGFWCEPGAYKRVGPIPTSFPSAFPAAP